MTQQQGDRAEAGRAAMPADSLESPVFRSAPTCCRPASSPSAFSAAPRRAPQESLQGACNSRAQQRQHQPSSDGDGTTALPAAAPYLNGEGLCFLDQDHHPFSPLSLKLQNGTVTATTAATAVPLARTHSVTAAETIAAAATAAAKTVTRGSKAAEAALDASGTTRATTTATPAAKRDTRSASTQLEKGVTPTTPACMHAICCGALPLSEESSREAGSCKCSDPAAGIAASPAARTSVAEVAVAGGTRAAEAAAESPFLRRGTQQAGGLEDIVQGARLRRTIITSTRAESVGGCAALGADVAAIFQEGFASQKRRRHGHQEVQQCRPHATAAGAAAATSCSSLQRSRSPPLLPTLSVPLLQQLRQEQQRKPCAVVSEQSALRAASAKAPTELSRAPVIGVPASPQSRLCYRDSFISSVAAEGQEAYNAAIGSEARTVAAGVAALCWVSLSSAEADLNTEATARITQTGHSQLLQTINSNAIPLASAASVAKTSVAAASVDSPKPTGGRSALLAAATSKRTGKAVAERTGPAPTKECGTVPCQVSPLNCDPKWLLLLQRLQRRASNNCLVNVETQAHGSITSGKTRNGNVAQQVGSSLHKKLSGRCGLGNPRKPLQEHQQQHKARIHVAALRRSLLQRQVKAKRHQKTKRVSRRPSTARQPGLSYSSHCSRYSVISSEARLKAASPKQERSGTASDICSESHSCTSSGSVTATQKPLHAHSGSPSKERNSIARSPEESQSSSLPHGAAGTQRAPVIDGSRSTSSLKRATAAAARTNAAAAVTSSVTPYAEEGINCSGGSKPAAAAAAAVKAAADAADAAGAAAAATVVSAATVAATPEAPFESKTLPSAGSPHVAAAAQTSSARPQNVNLTSETPTHVKGSSCESSCCSCCKIGHCKEVKSRRLQHCQRQGPCVGCMSSKQLQQHQQRQHREGKRRRPVSGSAKPVRQAGDQKEHIVHSHSSSSGHHKPQSADGGFRSMTLKHSQVVANSASKQALSAFEGESDTIAAADAGPRALPTDHEECPKAQLRSTKHSWKLQQTTSDVHQQQQSRYREKLAKMRHQLQEQQLFLQEQQLNCPLQRPLWNNTTGIAAGEAAQAPQPRSTTKLPAAALEVISARLAATLTAPTSLTLLALGFRCSCCDVSSLLLLRLYERARQQLEIRELRRQLHQQQQQLILVQGQQRSLPGRLSGCHSNSSNNSSKRGCAAERKHIQSVELQHEHRVLQQLHRVSLQQRQQREQRLQRGRSSRTGEGPTEAAAAARASSNDKRRDVAAQQQHNPQAHSHSMSSMRQHPAQTQLQRQQEKDTCGALFAPESRAAEFEKSNSSSRASSSGRHGTSSTSSDRQHFPLKAPNEQKQCRQQQRRQHQPQHQQLHNVDMHIFGLRSRPEDQMAGPRKPDNRVLSDQQQQGQRQHQRQLALLRQQKQQQNQQLLQLQQHLEEERLLHQRDMRHRVQQLQQLQQEIKELQEERLQEKLHQKQLQERGTLHWEQQHCVPTTATAAPGIKICTKMQDSSMSRDPASVQTASLDARRSSSLFLNGWQASSCGGGSAASASHHLSQRFQSETTTSGAVVGKFGSRKPFYQLSSSTWPEGEFRDSVASGHPTQELFLLSELQQQLQPGQQQQRKLAPPPLHLEHPQQQQQHKQKHVGHPRLTGDPTSLLLQLRKIYNNSNAQQQHGRQQEQQEKQARALALQALCSADLRDVQERRVAALLQRQFVQQQNLQRDHQPQRQKPQPGKLTFGYSIQAERRSPLRSEGCTNSTPATASAGREGLAITGATGSEAAAVAAAAASRVDFVAAKPAETRRCDTKGPCFKRPVMFQQQQERRQSPLQQNQPTHVIRGSSSKAGRSQQALQRSSLRSSPTVAIKKMQQPQQSQGLQQEQQKKQLQLKIEKDGGLCPSLRQGQQQHQRGKSHQQQQSCPDLGPRPPITSQQQSQRQLEQQTAPLSPTHMLKAQGGRLRLSQQQLLLPDSAVDMPQHQKDFLHEVGITTEQRQPLHVIHRRNVPLQKQQNH
ncbi:hypothetical protein ACSSS7_006936 [Eimeria intestinalis]